MKGLRFIRMLALLLVGGLAMLAAGVALLLAVDLSAYRGVLESRLSTLLDRHLVLGGEIRVSLTPLPTVTASQVSIVNPDWAQEPYLATAERLSVDFRLRPLLRGELQIARVRLMGGEVHLETRPDGTGNWLPEPDDRVEEAIPAGPHKIALLAQLPRIEVLESRVAYRDGHSGVVTPVEIAWARVAAPGGGALRIAFLGSLRGHALQAEMQGGTLLELVEGDEPWPVKVTLADAGNRVRAEGHLRRRPAPWFDLRLEAAGSQFAALAPLLGAPLPALGPFQVQGRLIRDDTGYTLRGVRGFLGQPDADLRLTIRAGDLEAPFTKPVRLDATGEYRGEAFDLSVRAGPYARLLAAEEPWEGRASLHLQHSRLTVEGALEPATGDFRASVEADGDDLASLGPAVGRRLPHLGPYALSAEVQREGRTWHLPRFSVQSGGSHARGALALRLDGERPGLSGRLESDRLELADLSGVFSFRSSDGPDPDAGRSLADRPLPQSWLRLLDLDLALSAARVRGAGPELVDLRAHLMVTDGVLEADVAHVRIAGEDLAGRIALQPTTGEPHGELDVEARNVAYGPVLAALGITDRLEGQAERLRFTLRGSGSTLWGIWRTSVLSLNTENALLAVLPGDGGVPPLIGLAEGTVTTGQLSGLALEAQGQFRERPYQVRLTGGGLRALFDAMEPWEVAAAGTYGGSRLRVEGRILDPVGGRGAALDVHADGADLSQLGRLLGQPWPALGPYRVGATLKDAARGLVLENLTAQVGQSDLAGELAFVATEVGPQVRARLRSRSLRLADLRPALRAIPDAEPAPPAPVPPAEGEGAPAPPARASERAIPDFAYPVADLRRAELDLAYTAERLLVGTVEVRAISAEGRLRDGKLTVQPLRGQLWGGTVTGELTVDASGHPVRTQLTLGAKSLEYTQATSAPGKAGVRRGTISLVAHLAGKGNGLRETAGSANGVVEFLGGAGQIDNRLLDLWASDLFLAAVPEFGERKATPVRCLLGRFTVENGRAETKSLLADLERLVVKGVGSVNLQDETVDLLLWPEPRDRSLLRVTTPLQVSGTLTHPEVSPQARGVLEEVTWLLVGASNPFVLLFGLIHPGTPDQDPCTVAAQPQQGGAVTSAEYSPPTPLSKAWEFLKGVGRMISSPFEGDEAKPASRPASQP